MPKLKSREQFIPGQFQFLLAETGQTTPFSGSFNAVCLQTLAIIKGNPFLAKKHDWPSTMEGVEALVERYNVQRCLSAGWTQWLLLDSPEPVVPSYDQKKTMGFRQSVVGSGSRIKAGIGILMDWLGDGGLPVDHSLAVARASVCATCPKNDGGDFTAFFTKPIAEKIRTQLEMRQELNLSTPSDAKLTVCSACLCPLKLKVHVPLSYALKFTEEETVARLDPRCWMLSENRGSGSGADPGVGQILTSITPP